MISCIAQFQDEGHLVCKTSKSNAHADIEGNLIAGVLPFRDDGVRPNLGSMLKWHALKCAPPLSDVHRRIQENPQRTLYEDL